MQLSEQKLSISELFPSASGPSVFVLQLSNDHYALLEVRGQNVLLYKDLPKVCHSFVIHFLVLFVKIDCPSYRKIWSTTMANQDHLCMHTLLTRLTIKDKDQLWSCDCIVKETLWNRSEKVDHLAYKYWCVLQGSGIIKMIRNLAQSW